MADPGELHVTRLLQRWKDGDRSAERELFEVFYTELKRSADRLMASERADHTLRPTALVNEAYLRLAPADVDWRDRSHFLALAARTMRRVLVDHARARARDKRGGGAAHVTLDAELMPAESAVLDLLVLDRALERLRAWDERKASVIELRYLAGLGNREIAEAVGVSERTVKRDLRFGRAWLRREIEKQVA